MTACDTCGSDTGVLFTVTQDDRSGTFDTLQCAAHAIAPTCERCGCRILGHPVRRGPEVFCSTHCAVVVARNIGRWKDDGGAVLD